MLTAPQRRCLLVIQRATELFGRPPTYAEIAADLGRGPTGRGGAYALVRALVDRGYVVIVDRTVKVIKPDTRYEILVWNDTTKRLDACYPASFKRCVGIP